MLCLRQDFLSRGVTEEDVLYHLAFYHEFLWRVIDPSPYPEGTQLKIIDLSGISFSDFNSEVISFMKRCAEIVGDNHPERLYKIFILNPPSWFSIMWKALSPLINPKTRDKVRFACSCA